MAVLAESLEARVERGLGALRREFPAEAERVNEIGHAHFDHLRAGARIEDFLPILVYRFTREDLLGGRAPADESSHRSTRPRRRARPGTARNYGRGYAPAPIPVALGGATMAEERKCDMTMLTTDEYLQAEFGYTLAEARRGFKIHAAVYGVVMTGLVTLNALLIAFTGANFPWVIFPLVGWGIGLTGHYSCGFRGAERAIRARQAKIEDYATRPRVAA
jgi:hypothetical protein